VSGKRNIATSTSSTSTSTTNSHDQ
jgi:hypothetical protein